MWAAPIAGYAPAFVKDSSVGYVFSAVAGVGAIGAIALLAGWVLRRRDRAAGRRRKTFVEKTTAALAEGLHDALFAEQIAGSHGFLQGIDPRVKLAGIASLVIATVIVQRLWVIAAILAFAVVAARFSGISLRTLSTRAWLAVLAFAVGRWMRATLRRGGPT